MKKLTGKFRKHVISFLIRGTIKINLLTLLGKKPICNEKNSFAANFSFKINNNQLILQIKNTFQTK